MYSTAFDILIKILKILSTLEPNTIELIPLSHIDAMAVSHMKAAIERNMQPLIMVVLGCLRCLMQMSYHP